MQNLFNKTYVHYTWKDTNNIMGVFDAVENQKINKLIIFGPEEYSAIKYDECNIESLMFDGYMKSRNVDVYRVVGVDLSKRWNPSYKMTYDTNSYGWGTFFAYSVVFDAFINKKKPAGHTQLTKSFISLNRRAHTHRCMFIDILHKYKLQEHGIITWHMFQTPVCDYEFKHWDPMCLTVDEPGDPINNFHLYPYPPQFQKTLFSVVSESSSDMVFLTEKTFMPIFHKRPFLIFGGKNIHKYLKTLKFKLFDEIIDYSFDSVDDEYERFDMAMRELKKICKHDPNNLLKLIKPKIEYNYANLLNIVKYSIGVDEEVTKIVNNWPDGIGNNYKDLLNFGKFPEFDNLYDNTTRKKI